MSKLLAIVVVVAACQPARTPAPQHPAPIVRSGPGRADVDETAMRARPIDEQITTGHERCADAPSPIDDTPRWPLNGQDPPRRRQYLAKNAKDCAPLPIPKL